MDVLSQDSGQSYASLRISLEMSIKTLSKNDTKTLEVFKFLGLLPGGVNQNELTELWDDEWREEKEKLVKASLLVYRPGDNFLSMLPFMHTRALELLDEDIDGKKRLYHIKICKFLKKF